MKPLYGNVVRVETQTDKIKIIRFAIDKFLEYKDKSTSKYHYGSYYADLKFFDKTFDKFNSSNIKTGTRMVLTDYDLLPFSNDYNPDNPTITKLSLIVNDFEAIVKNVNNHSEAIKSNIVLNKPIAQYNADKNHEGNSSWMNE